MTVVRARLALPISLLFAALLACTGGGIESVAGHVTPYGTVFSPTATYFIPTDAPTLALTPTKAFTPLPPISPSDFLAYQVQTGDTLDLLAQRFSVPLADILKINNLTAGEVLKDEEVIFIPARLDQTGPDFKIVPDSETVYSLGVAGFDVDSYVKAQGGYLARHTDFVRGSTISAAEAVRLVALDHSISPRLLLALLEYQSGWVTNPAEPLDKLNPIFPNPRRQGLFNQLNWLADTLNLGYYRWRDGRLSALDFLDGAQVRLSPTLNAGTVAVQFALSRFYPEAEWQAGVGPDGVAATYTALFGKPFEKAVEPLIPNNLPQPELHLPFEAGATWSLISGPHRAWEQGSPWAALDFAPPAISFGCLPSEQWVVAPAAGQVVRSGEGVVIIDLDGDGREQSGWAILLLHIGNEGRIPAGANVEAGDRLGHPSCEGGRSTGTHVHLARKFNGEWIPAEGSIPFELGGWMAHFGPREYTGTLTKGDDTVTACECSAEVSGISISR